MAESHTEVLIYLDKVIREAEDLIAHQSELLRQVREAEYSPDDARRTLEAMTSAVDTLKRYRAYLLQLSRRNLH